MKSVPVSVVITAYNSERFVAEAIRSVQRQTLGVDEIIVVDNNSTDNTRKIAAGEGAEVFGAKKQCPAATRNKGIRVSRNEWIAFLDADDLWDEEKIEYQWRAFEKYPDVRVLSCDAAMFTDPAKLTKSSTKLSQPVNIDKKRAIIGKTFCYSSDMAADLFRWFWIIPSGVILHREVFGKIGLFDEDLFLMEDMDLFCRALKHFPIATVNKNLAFYRRHQQNTTLRSEILERFEVILINDYVAKFPDRYVPGTLEYLIERQKQAFVAKGMAMAEKIRRSESDK
jgi:glycosyltransferase involved in cell wall biosynthesis